MAASSGSTSRNVRAASDSGSDSEDDDFIPEPDTCHGATGPSKASATAHAASADGSDSETEDRALKSSIPFGQEIDADELEALKREREELVAAAGGEGRLGKRRRLAQTTSSGTTDLLPVNDEAEALKAKALAEWEAIKGSESAPPNSETAATPSANAVGEEEMVSIPTTYKFAGELHTSTRLLPRSHPDAIKYLSSQSVAAATTSAPPYTSVPPSARPSSLASTPASTSASAASPRPRPPTTAGPRRKKPSSLAALSAAVSSTKPAKLNTLEKSKLDWDTFKADHSKLSQQQLDELEHQTKGGGKGLGDMKGYLERSDFLDRVKNRTGQQ